TDRAGNTTTSSVEVSERTWGPASTVQVSAGLDYTCALAADGTVSCWGNNQYGQLGDGTNTTHLVPVRVNLTDVVQISAGGGNTFGAAHTCAVKSNGDVWCWGSNDYGGLGDGTQNASNVPVKAGSISKAIQVSAGILHSCALISNGTIK